MKRQATTKVDTSVDASPRESVNLSVTEIGARIKLARKAVGLTQGGLAALAGATSNRGLQDNEGGKSMPGGQMIGALIHAGINANWVITGNGPMMLADFEQALSAPAPKINVDALQAIIEGALKVAKNAPVSAIAAHAARVYMQCLEEGLITPDGVGEGNHQAVA